MNSTSKFNVGDKVRILDVDAIMFGREHWKNGDVTECVGHFDGTGSPVFKSTEKVARTMTISTREFHAIELAEAATPKLTKKRRIDALEKDVARQETELEELRAKIEAFEAMMKDRATRTAKSLVKVCAGGGFVEVDGQHMFVKTSVTPNQRRAQIIADAKGFVEQTIEDARDEDGDIYVEPFSCSRIDFVVDDKKRTVVALAIGYMTGTVIEKAIAKCAPDDVFNADIGKAIAVGRLFGLDVERFINAPKPDEFVVGHVISVKSSVPGEGVYLIGKVKQLRPLGRIVFDAEHTEVLTNGYCDLRYEVGVPNGSKIIDDTEAQYE